MEAVHLSSQQPCEIGQERERERLIKFHVVNTTLIMQNKILSANQGNCFLHSSSEEFNS